jgi:hypothetical protein
VAVFRPPYPTPIAVPCQTPVPIVPTVVSEEVTTVDARAVPVKVPAGAITAVEPAAVISPLALTVKVGIAVEEPKLPVLPFTDASVKAPPEPRVASPDMVSASKSPLLSVPIRYAERTPVSLTVAAVRVVVIVVAFAVRVPVTAAFRYSPH